jgi:type IV secretion system protein VirD4
LRPEELRQLPDKQALVIAENARPIIARLHRCIEGRDGRRLLAQQRALREELAAGRDGGRDVEARTAAALVEAQRHGW